MDMQSAITSTIKSAVIDQLENVNGLYSLMLQNHIYGCFILMEDISQNKFELNGTVISTSTFKFDIDKQFSEIGIRYGFAMDTKLILDICKPEYKNAWLAVFNDIYVSKNIEEADKIEDSIIEVMRSIKDSFFFNALETGSLSQEWIDKVLNLLNQDVEVEKTAISKAITEKPIQRIKTRRVVKNTSKNPLAKTRRNR
jgi:hypothetical protein